MPLESHWATIKCILCYLSNTVTHELLLTSAIHLPKFSLCAYSDFDWASDPDDRRSTSSSCVFFGLNLVAWSSKKQVFVASSNTNVAYQALTHTTIELLWLESLLSKLHIEYLVPTLQCDNLRAVLLPHNPILHARTNHIELDIHFVREKVLANHMHIQHVPAHAQLVVALTKPLPIVSFTYF